MRIVFCGLSLIIAVLCSACPGSLENPQRFTGDGGANGCSLSNIQAELVEARCATSGCHDGTTAAEGLNLLDDGSLASRLLGVNAQGEGCEAELLINANDTASSYLINKLGANPSCGLTMPLTPPLLTEEELTCMQNWVDALVAEQ